MDATARYGLKVNGFKLNGFEIGRFDMKRGVQKTIKSQVAKVHNDPGVKIVRSISAQKIVHFLTKSKLLLKRLF